jgi:predicted aldo/keto reductase-like oxidoreductase
MEYRELGSTGIRASVIGMGSEGLVGMADAEASALLSAALEGGVNYFDLYNPQPEVRRHLGKAVASCRDRVFLQGHLCTAWIGGQYTRTRDPALTRASFEEMLALLGTGYVDVGMIHYIDTQADFEQVFGGEILRYAQQLLREGKIRHLGISSHNPLVARRAVETGLVEVVMFAVNPAYDMQPPGEDLERLWAEESYVHPLHNLDPDRDALHKLCAAKGVGITVMKAFGGGDLLDEKLSPFGVRMTPAQCIHYALSRPGVASVLGGFATPQELRAGLAYCEMSAAQRDYAEVLARVPRHTFQGKCMYCGHCAPCTAGIDIASVNKFYDLCLAQKSVPETVREHYGALAHHAGECIGCGRCERNCPFGVKIIEEMRAAAALFGK